MNRIQVKEKCLRTTRHEHGLAMIELALALPLLLIIALAVFDFSTLFRNYQRLSMVSRESANLAFRQCLAFDSDAAITECLEKTHDDIGLELSSVTGHELILSLYELDIASGDVARRGIFPAGGSTVSGYSTRYDAPRVKSDVLSLKEGNTRAVVSEVFLREIPFWRRFERTYYESTIF